MAGVVLGTAAQFAVLAGSTVTNTGPTTLTGSLGLSPGSAVTGFPPGVVSGGATHAADAVAAQAEIDLGIAYTTAAGLTPTADLTGQDLGGLTLTPGVYHFASSAQLTGTLTLDFQGNPEAQFVFQIGSTLTTASNSRVAEINTGSLAPACDVFFQVGSSATLGTATSFEGHILALTSITLNTNAQILSGSVLARNGAVTLDSVAITVCADAIPTPPPIPPVTPPTTPTINPIPGPNPTPPPNPPINPIPGPNPTPPPHPNPNPNQPPTPGSPPQTVVDLRRFGFHAQRTLFVLTFSGPVDPVQAENVSNYDLRFAGGGRLSGSRIAIDSATYDPVMHTVILAPHDLVSLRQSYRLTLSGLGVSYAKTFGDEALAGPTPRPLVAHGSQHPAPTFPQPAYTVWDAATRHRVFWKILHGR